MHYAQYSFWLVITSTSTQQTPHFADTSPRLLRLPVCRFIWIETETISWPLPLLSSQTAAVLSFFFRQQVVPECPIFFLDRTLQKSSVAKFSLLIVTAESIRETAILWSQSVWEKLHHLTEPRPISTVKTRVRVQRRRILGEMTVRGVNGGGRTKQWQQLNREDTHAHALTAAALQSRSIRVETMSATLQRSKRLLSHPDLPDPPTLPLLLVCACLPAQCAVRSQPASVKVHQSHRASMKSFTPSGSDRFDASLSQQAATAAACRPGLLAASELSSSSSSSLSPSIT